MRLQRTRDHRITRITKTITIAVTLGRIRSERTIIMDVDDTITIRIIEKMPVDLNSARMLRGARINDRRNRNDMILLNG